MKHSDYQALNDDEVAVCPECDSSALIMNSTSALKADPDELDRYRCRACDATCDEFVRREKASDRGPTRGLAARLADADADEVSR
jgi:transposase-like protein